MPARIVRGPGRFAKRHHGRRKQLGWSASTPYVSLPDPPGAKDPDLSRKRRDLEPETPFGTFPPNSAQRSLMRVGRMIPAGRYARKMARPLRSLLRRLSHTPIDVTILGQQRMRLHPHGNACETRILILPHLFDRYELRMLSRVLHPRCRVHRYRRQCRHLRDLCRAPRRARRAHHRRRAAFSCARALTLQRAAEPAHERRRRAGGFERSLGNRDLQAEPAQYRQQLDLCSRRTRRGASSSKSRAKASLTLPRGTA